MKLRYPLVALALLLSHQALYSAVFVVTSTADGGPGTLRQAILGVNGSPGPHSIEFNLPGTGVQTIAPLTAFQDLTNRVAINGYSQPGSKPNEQVFGNDAVLRVRLDGTKLTNSFATALRIRAGGSSVRGLIIVRFPYGVEIASCSGNAIAGNWIGIDFDGVARGMVWEGVYVSAGAASAAINNVIGGASPADANVISGNRSGVSFFAANAANNAVLGNFIGTDPTGRLPRGNMFEAVNIQAATNITITGNVLSACTAAGGTGIRIVGGGGHVIRNNLVGHGISGQDLGNSASGIMAQGATGLVIGGSPGGMQGNRIGFNRANGIELQGCSGSEVSDNNIGSGSSGAEPWGNAQAGILLNNSSSNHIRGNLILFNGAAGISVLSGTANNLELNSTFDNAGLGVDLGGNGATTNDVLDVDLGANGLQNHPVLGEAVLAYGSVNARGSLNSAPNTVFRLDFFLTEPWDPQWIPEGQVPLGSMLITTDAAGTATFNYSTTGFDWMSEGAYLLTATATDPAGNTSELSPGVALSVGAAVPSLQIGTLNGNPVVSWPSTAVMFQLESTASLTMPADWSPVTNGIVPVADQNRLVITNRTLPQQFYRLKKK